IIEWKNLYYHNCDKSMTFISLKRSTPNQIRIFLEQLQTTEGIIGMGLPVDKTLLDRAPRLKIVSNVSVGYNNLDIEQLSKRGIMATHTPEVLNDTVADAIFGILLATARRIPELDRMVKRGEWTTE